MKFQSSIAKNIDNDQPAAGMQSSHWWAGGLLMVQTYGPNYKWQHGSSRTMAQAFSHSLTTEAQSHTNLCWIY